MSMVTERRLFRLDHAFGYRDVDPRNSLPGQSSVRDLTSADLSTCCRFRNESAVSGSMGFLKKSFIADLLFFRSHIIIVFTTGMIQPCPAAPKDDSLNMNSAHRGAP